MYESHLIAPLAEIDPCPAHGPRCVLIDFANGVESRWIVCATIDRRDTFQCPWVPIDSLETLDEPVLPEVDANPDPSITADDLNPTITVSDAETDGTESYEMHDVNLQSIYEGAENHAP